LAQALIVGRLLEPAAKLATARMLDGQTASHSLGDVLGLGAVTARELYATLDWLGAEQDFIEASLARRHLVEAERDYVRLHVGTRSFLMSGTLTSIESRLNADQFVRAHRSWIIRRSQVSAMKRVPAGGWVAVLKDGREIPIGRKFVTRIR
jgi:two-component system response regulator AlgR